MALASCSSFKDRRFWSSFTSACSIAFWSWLWIMKSSRRLAMSSSRSVTCSIPRRSSDSSSACWYVNYKLLFHEITMRDHTLYSRYVTSEGRGLTYPVQQAELLILSLHLTRLPVLVDFDPGNWCRSTFDTGTLKQHK